MPASQQAAPSAAEAAVLIEVTAHERAIVDLKSIFEGVHAVNGHGNKAELATSVQNSSALEEVLKNAEMNAILMFVNKLAAHDGDFVSWEDFVSFAEKAAVQAAGHEVVEVVEEEAKREMEEIKQEVAAGIAAMDQAKEQALTWLQGVFESFTHDDEGTVSKEELETKLKNHNEEVNGESAGDLINRAGFNPLWNALAGLDTNKDGNISWDEFKAHATGPTKEVEPSPALEPADEIPTSRRFFGCC